MAPIRTFIAIELSATISKYLDQLVAELRKRVINKSVRWIPTENIHLTLRFLGDTELDLLPGLKLGLSDVAAQHRAFRLHLDKLGCFPSPRRPRIIWAGVESSGEKLAALQRDVAAMLLRLGWKSEDRRFHPHLTLGRVKDVRTVLEARYPWGLQLDSLDMQVHEICLIESVLRPSGAEYHVRHKSILNQTNADDGLQ